ESNAVGKAQYYAKQSDLVTLAEDSGITVPSVSVPGFDAHHPEPGRQKGGVPGVYSAHFAESPREANLKLLAMLSRNPDAADARYAFYCCVACLAWPQGRMVTTVGRCEGSIAPEPCGGAGFGYDPIFYYPPFGRTFGETPPELKNRVSHRAIALRALLSSLRSFV
ncbi:MAG: non-canonical purine NTP pyrophosphatase, partial [bacterium]